MIFTGLVDDGDNVLVSCLGDLFEEVGTELTCNGASFVDSESKNLLEVLPCSFEGNRCVHCIDMKILE